MRFLIILFSIPVVSQAAPAPTDFKSFVSLLLDLFNLIVPLIFALTFLTIVWGLIKAWILHADDASEIEKGKKIAVVGVIAFVVMVSIWGIIAFLRSGLFGI